MSVDTAICIICLIAATIAFPRLIGWLDTDGMAWLAERRKRRALAEERRKREVSMQKLKALMAKVEARKQ